jgi:hypothetical protein
MRFENFVKESKVENIEEILEIKEKIEKECKFYLKLLKGKEPLVRGVNFRSFFKMEVSGLKYIRKDRTPKGTKDDYFEMINKWLKSKGHVPRDNCLFSTSKKDLASFHGLISYVYPVGKFDYSWINAKDFNIKDGKWPGINELFSLYSKDEALNILEKRITTNKGFDEAYNSGFEIWFGCKKYYYIKNNYK